MYALALIEADPRLRLGAVSAGDGDVENGHALHWFAHDDHWAYDSTGRYPLPYVRVWDSVFHCYFPPEFAAAQGFRCVLDIDPSTGGALTGEDAEALPAARRHIRRNAILSGGER